MQTIQKQDLIEKLEKAEKKGTIDEMLKNFLYKIRGPFVKDKKTGEYIDRDKSMEIICFLAQIIKEKFPSSLITVKANSGIDEYMIASHQKIGGKHWENYGKSRVYYNADSIMEIIELELDFYKTGNICSAELQGEKISNSRARKILGTLESSKLWFDLDDYEYHYKSFDSELMNDVIDKIEQKIKGINETGD